MLIIRVQVVTAARTAQQIAFVNQPLKTSAVVLRDTRSWLASWRQEEAACRRKNTAQNGVNQRLAHLLLQTAARVEINV